MNPSALSCNTGSTLKMKSDEHVESIHSKYKQFVQRHGYHVNNTASPMQHLKQHKAVIHWNSVNI